MASSTSDVQIIPYYAHPHVHTVINDHTWYDETVATTGDSGVRDYSTLVVTGADKGIDNTFVRLVDYELKKKIFGVGNYDKYGQSSIQADTLFNGNTAVWFCRVLPDNATYSNIVIMAYYKKSDEVDSSFTSTGLKRMDIKFGIAYGTKPYITNGATTDEVLSTFASSLTKTTADPLTGYFAVPICYIRSTGRGRYGNNYSISVTRDYTAENDYKLKMYDFNVIANTSDTNATLVTDIISGALFQTTRYGGSMFISDVIDQYMPGRLPIVVKPFEESFETLYKFYKDIVDENATTLASRSDITNAQRDDLSYAQSISIDAFDPLFGLKYLTKASEKIPYYHNYTVLPSGAYVSPSQTIATLDLRPSNISAWASAAVGATVLVESDSSNEDKCMRYTVTAIDQESGAISYDEGTEEDPDASQYDGVDISANSGNTLLGGHDGDFQEITSGSTPRTPTAAEMKLLLSKEYVKAFRGEKDRKILSPARMDLDFIFDANYNMTSEDEAILDTTTAALYNGSTILTDEDAQQLAILSSSNSLISFSDINVKQAMYDLNEFRNKNGMTINPEQGAGCHLYLDCNLLGGKSLSVNYELINTIEMFSSFESRACSIDLGYYEIYDPRTSKRIKVTTSYFLAQNLVPHLIAYGMNKPFTYNYAKLQAIQREGFLAVSGNMIRDTFRPDIDLIDWDVKEKLYKSRINYYITSDEGRIVQRAAQNTRQLDASALLEENNVRVLNKLKKELEEACRGYLYEWNEPEVREGYTKAQMERYRSWIGTLVQDMEIVFTANEWEQERMIMHCYVTVKFRDIVKRIILEINIQRPTYDNSTSGSLIYN